MKLFDGGRAPNPRRVRVFLAEKGIAVPLVKVDMAAMEHRGEAVASRNPLRRLPVLELDDGTVISESVAICRYFEEIQPEPALFGRGALGKARVEMWQRRMELELFGPITQVFRNLHPFFAGRIPQVAEWGEVCRKAAESRLAWLDGILADREFIAGDRYTIADITALCGVDFGRVSKIRIQPEHTNLARWHAAVSARPSAKA